MRTAMACAIILAPLASVGCTDTTSAPTPIATNATATTTVRPAVAWPATKSIDDRALGFLVTSTRTESEVRALVARSPVPVLAPKDLRLASPSLVVEGEYFALTGRANGATISVQGTRAAHRYEGVAPVAGNRDVRGTKGFVSVNEEIRTASWMENGAAYSVDVECSDLHEARCRNDDFLLSVVTQLTYVGGSGR